MFTFIKYIPVLVFSKFTALIADSLFASKTFLPIISNTSIERILFPFCVFILNKPLEGFGCIEIDSNNYISLIKDVVFSTIVFMVVLVIMGALKSIYIFLLFSITL